MDFYCGTCGEKLTATPLREAASEDIRYEDGIEALSRGCFVKAEQLDVIFDIHVTHVVHTKSLRLIDHCDAVLLQGCCGPGRLDCYNQVCFKCNEPVGLLFADCWAMHFTAVNEDKLTPEPK